MVIMVWMVSSFWISWRQSHLVVRGPIVNVLLPSVCEEDVEPPLLGQEVEIPVELQFESFAERLESDLKIRSKRRKQSKVISSQSWTWAGSRTQSEVFITVHEATGLMRAFITRERRLRNVRIDHLLVRPVATVPGELSDCQHSSSVSDGEWWPLHTPAESPPETPGISSSAPLRWGRSQPEQDNYQHLIRTLRVVLQWPSDSHFIKLVNSQHVVNHLGPGSNEILTG